MNLLQKIKKVLPQQPQVFPRDGANVVFNPGPNGSTQILKGRPVNPGFNPPLNVTPARAVPSALNAAILLGGAGPMKNIARSMPVPQNPSNLPMPQVNPPLPLIPRGQPVIGQGMTGTPSPMQLPSRKLVQKIINGRKVYSFEPGA